MPAEAYTVYSLVLTGLLKRRASHRKCLGFARVKNRREKISRNALTRGVENLLKNGVSTVRRR